LDTAEGAVLCECGGLRGVVIGGVGAEGLIRSFWNGFASSVNFIIDFLCGAIYVLGVQTQRGDMRIEVSDNVKAAISVGVRATRMRSGATAEERTKAAAEVMEFYSKYKQLLRMADVAKAIGMSAMAPYNVLNAARVGSCCPVRAAEFLNAAARCLNEQNGAA
jgi:hypothetical protein